MLMSPDFLFRVEQDPRSRGAGCVITGSAELNWPPDSRSSCGAAFPTTNC